MDNVPATQEDSSQVTEARALLDLLLEEANKRLNDPRQIKKLSTGELLIHIEKILMAIKKQNIAVSQKFSVDLGKFQHRVKTIDEHPANRKELREKLRDAVRITPIGTR